MKRSDIQHMPQFFDRYILLVDDIDVVEGLQQTANLYHDEGIRQAMLQIGDQVYAPGKWTAKDILQHLIDNERIMSYRPCALPAMIKLRFPVTTKSCLGPIQRPTNAVSTIYWTNSRWSVNPRLPFSEVSALKCCTAKALVSTNASVRWRWALC